MSRKRHSEAHGSSERWLVSYADFITLMFAFFVVMFSSARMDQKKAAQMAAAVQTAFQELGTGASARTGVGHAGPAAARDFSRDITPPGLQTTAFKKDDFAAIQAELEKALEAELRRQEVALRMQSDGLVVSLREIGFFDSGSAVLRPNAEAAFQRITKILQAHQCEVRVEGHTDNVPIHNGAYASNWELSTARATEVVEHLIGKYKFPPDRLSAAGYGEFRPVAKNNGELGRKYNRRVDVVIVAAQIVPSPLARTRSSGDKAESNAEPEDTPASTPTAPRPQDAATSGAVVQ